MEGMETAARAELLLLVAVPWVAASALVAWVGRRRGQSGVEGLLVSLFLSPLFGILYVGALPDRSREFEEAEAAAAADAEHAAARREKRLCESCGFLSNHPFQGKCPECGVPRGAATD